MHSGLDVRTLPDCDSPCAISIGRPGLRMSWKGGLILRGRAIAFVERLFFVSPLFISSA